MFTTLADPSTSEQQRTTTDSVTPLVLNTEVPGGGTCVLRSCQYCHRMFRQAHHLVRHIRTHTGEKPYKCPDCPYEATQQHHVSRHIANKHPGTALKPLRYSTQ